jgi:hypothetical protein
MQNGLLANRKRMWEGRRKRQIFAYSSFIDRCLTYFSKHLRIIPSVKHPTWYKNGYPEQIVTFRLMKKESSIFVRVCWGSGTETWERMRKTNEQVGNSFPELSQSLTFTLNTFQEKRKEGLFAGYFRLRKSNAAAAAMTTTTAAPMTMYVVVGIPLVGGCGASLGEGATDCAGVGVVTTAGVVGGSVGRTIGATAETSETVNAVPATLL